ncbi:MAG: alpha/beta fold hydrolase [Actinomycetes bacterium]
MTDVETGVRHIEANGIDIAFETFGDPSGSPVLLVMGLGTQMLAWPEDFCEALAARGHYVIRFDNRDSGLSTHLYSVRAPNPVSVYLGRAKPPYTLDDCAKDTLGLMDALGLPSVHLVGISMGGFVAQTVAVAHPERLRSLTLMMTSTGNRLVGYAKPKMILNILRRRTVRTRDEAMDAAVETFRSIGSPGYDVDEERIREVAARAFDRAHDPGGYLRQLSAIMAQPDRTAKLRQLAVPTLVIHGRADPLVNWTGGRALAKAIPGAKLHVFPGMGHDMPRALWPRFAEEIGDLAERGDGQLPARSGFVSG